MKNRNHLIDLNKIKQLAAERGFSYKQLADKIGLTTRMHIFNRVSNRVVITADELFLIADALGVKTDDLRLTQRNIL